MLTDPADYAELVAALRENRGATPLALRRRLAAKAFARTAAYDAAIARWYAGELGEALPATLSVSAQRLAPLRYGENPHQAAAFYAGEPAPGSLASARQLQGKALSYNNLQDADAALMLVADLDPDQPAAAIIKHANPCGVAIAETLEAAYQRALKCDPVSAFGGIIAINRPLDAATAERIAEIFTEVIIAPEVEEGALAVLKAKKTLRLLVTGGLPQAQGLHIRSIAGGLLVQRPDARRITAADCRVVTKRAPSAAETADLLFAFRVAKHVKSNAIVYARGGMTVGIGAGQMNRRDSSRIAALRAAEAAEMAGEADSLAAGSVVASDAFFPFADGLIAAADAGATAVIQPGGSVRDEEVIAAADERGLAMLFTGVRHFRH